MAAIATTDPREPPCAETVGEPSWLTEPLALASHRLTVGDATSEVAGNAEPGGSVVVVVVDVEVVDVEVVLVEVVVVVAGCVVERGMPPAVVGTVTPWRWCTGGVVVAVAVVVEVVDDAGSAGLVDGTVVVVVDVEDAGDPGRVVVDDVEELEGDAEVDAPVGDDGTGWALAANGASTASTPAAALVSPTVALSDQTTVRASFWTI